MDTDNDNISKLIDLVQKHDTWMNETINLIASENRLSPAASKVLMSDLGNRVAEGWLGERVFPGVTYYDEIERYGMDLVRKMFHAEFADVRPISGTMANMIIFNAFTSPGDVIASLSISSGAHMSMAGSTPRKIFHLNVLELPFDKDNLTINLDQTVNLIRGKKPKILVLGGSVLLFKQPVKELAKVSKEVGTIVLFDASHVAGLIVAGDYPNPLDEGADIMTMTTCKTIPGPQHAFILSKKEYAEKIKQSTFPGFLSGYHLNETAASIITMEEFKKFGKEYSFNILRNTKALAQYLLDAGFNILAKDKGVTETHMFLMDVSSLMTATEAEKRLEEANIIVNKNMLPADKSFANPSGLRFGAPEITRLGMKEEDMKIIASFITRVLIKKEEPAFIKKEVIEFRKRFTAIHYC